MVSDPGSSVSDAAFMRRALELARKGWGQTAPNPMVGAVVVRDGVVVGEGHHTRFGSAHAEVEALRAAGDRASGATIYVTLEPCAHTGKTPPCTDALVAARVARAVIAVRDPNPAAAGGVERLRDAGIEVAIGVEDGAARELNAPFFHSFVEQRPWITLKLAVSLDGALADATGHSRWITGDDSRRLVHEMRAGSDAIGVGIGTALADDPSLTVRDAPAPRVPPLRVVFDRAARLPLDSVIVRTAHQVPALVVAATPPAARVAALEAAGVRVIQAASLRVALDALGALGVRSLLVEGGARLAGALIGTGMVDRLVIFQGSAIFGAGALDAFAFVPPTEVERAPAWRALERREIGADTMTVYAPPSSD
ncbi:MAG TPA: bifunctional diaminohydroxyphosphoribosylaminopyrimidine deaminase/5-amino-6-(5-phosphoribosylamino)uracil reductase RibD [Gemmatimonadaceae bacterium]|nr:bifunctional diaminohydroxyphosphoribosylaminopyrimidine deaminase/5-amino-6-(5-phosphoribosylamino)uracil reductase RibD [Gemmatimonadaceae bacterium]